MYYNGQHAFDHSVAYHIQRRSTTGVVMLDQYMVFHFSLFHTVGKNGPSKRTVGRFKSNLTMDVFGKTYINSLGFLFSDCNKPQGYFETETHHENIWNSKVINLGTNDANMQAEFHRVCSDYILQRIQEECKYCAPEIRFYSANGIGLFNIHNNFPLSPTGIELMKKQYDCDLAQLSTFNILSEKRAVIDRAETRAIKEKDEALRRREAEWKAANERGGYNSTIDHRRVHSQSAQARRERGEAGY